MASENHATGSEMQGALALLSSKRPRDIGATKAGALLFGDWGTSRLYVLGIAFAIAGPASFWLICGMSVLILMVGFAYKQICRIYPDGGGVYAAGRRQTPILGVVGALLLFSDYVITASLSALDAFHYFGLENSKALFALNSPGMWAIVAIFAIGMFNLMGPKHTSGFALFAAIGMIAITLLIAAFAIPQIDWRQWPHQLGGLHDGGLKNWEHFVSVVLALSGVEAIASMAGVLKKPVGQTAGRALMVVAIEVAVFNIVLAAVMIASSAHSDPSLHKEDMLAHLSGLYVGPVFEWVVRILAGLLLLSATNTAIGGIIAVIYILARDRELPTVLQKLNPFGVPVGPAILAFTIPIVVLLIAHDITSLSSLYAIGVIGAVAMDITLCAVHPRLHRWYRKVPMFMLGMLLVAIWITLAWTKTTALQFVSIVMVIGLSLRFLTQWVNARAGDKPSLIRQAIAEQWKPETAMMKKMLLGTYGSDALAEPAMHLAKLQSAALVVCFIRELHLSDRFDSAQQRMTIDNDPAALRTFSRFLERGHEMGVTVLPAYDTGPDAAILMAETAAMFGCDHILIGSSRQGTMHRFVKGPFQKRIESVLPEEIKVEVLATERTSTAPVTPKAQGDEATTAN